MEKKTFYVEVGWIGNAKAPKQIPVKCTDEELDIVAPAIGKGYDADSCVVFLTGGDNRHNPVYARYWDCM
jgi:hypothetical protein